MKIDSYRLQQNYSPKNMTIFSKVSENEFVTERPPIKSDNLMVVIVLFPVSRIRTLIGTKISDLE